MSDKYDKIKKDLEGLDSNIVDYVTHYQSIADSNNMGFKYSIYPATNTLTISFKLGKFRVDHFVNIPEFDCTPKPVLHRIIDDKINVLFDEYRGHSWK